MKKLIDRYEALIKEHVQFLETFNDPVCNKNKIANEALEQAKKTIAKNYEEHDYASSLNKELSKKNFVLEVA